MKKKVTFFVFVFELICQICICTCVNAQTPTNGMVACYPFSGNANDMSGNNNNGTVYGATLTTDRFNRSNSAYYFDGNSDYISLPFTPFYLPSFSYSVWAYVASYPANNDQGMVISIGSYGGGNSVALCNSYSTGVTGWSCNVYYPGGQHYWIAGMLPTLNTWYHITMTRDENNLKCYLNGQLVSSQPANNTVPYYGTGPNLALIGKRCQTSLNQFFNGKIDDIHIYNRVLTATEVNNLYIGESNAVTITANPGTTINQGENVTFTAVVNSSITDPSYQWLVNNIVVGGNTATYSTLTLNNGDIVKCLVFPSQACEVPVYSNSLTITVNSLPSNGLVACYPFNGNANDGSGNNYHGTVYGATLATDRFGRPNNAYSFNGVDNYILLPGIVDIPVKTINLWFYSDTAIATHVLFDSDNPNLNYGKTTIEFNHYYNDSYLKMFAGSVAYQQIAETRNWNMATSVIVNDTGYFYLNGVFFGKIYNNKIHSVNGLSNIVIGSVRNLTTYYYKGKIDDIHIYNRALTATEVNNLYIGESNAVTITANPGTTINQGENVTFTAVVNSSITDPSYQWLVNNIVVGGNTATYSTSTLNNGDIVKCLVFPSQACEVPVYSNSLTITVIPLPGNGLVACYPFSGNANDGSGNNYNGTVNGATLTTDRFGRPNSAYNFDGNSDYISLPYTPFELPNYTYSVWVKPTAYPSINDVGIILGIGSYGGDQTISLTNQYGSGYTGLGFGNHCLSGGPFGWAPGFLPPLNIWYHLTIARDDAAVNFYIDGILFYSHPTNGATSYYGSGSKMATIGKREQMNLNQYFTGTIDDIHIYNRALTASEVLNLFIGELNAVTITPHPGNIIWAGTNVTFTSVVNSSITNPSYQWYLNGAAVGENSPGYFSSNLHNGDIVNCIVFSSDACEVPVLSNPVIMVVLPLSFVPTITQNGLILTSDIPEGNQWFLNGNNIPGAINQTYTCSENGTYAVNINLNGQSSPFSEPVVINSVKINELNNNNGLTIFPNPTNGEFTFSFNTTLELTYEIVITDVIGKQVYKESISGFSGVFTKQIDLTKMGKGLYTISLLNKDTKISKKIVID